MIENVKVSQLKQILDERGKLMHMLKNNADVFKGFGEIYFSCIYPGAVKGWHRHKEATVNLAAPWGRIKLVIYDNREFSATKDEIQELFLGPENYVLVTIPPQLWYGFKGIGMEAGIVANLSTIPYDPKENERVDPFDSFIPYNWRAKQGR